MIQTSESVYLDNGTTVLAVATALAGAADPVRPRNINILINRIEVAQTLAEVPGLRHVLLGGTYRTAGNSLTGPLTLNSLNQFSVSTAIIGVSGLVGGAFTVADLSEAQVESAFISRPARVVVVMDASKVGLSDFARACCFTAVDHLITDFNDPDVVRECDSAETELIIA